MSARVAVTLLAAGSCSHPERMTRASASWRPARFPSGFGLVEHETHGALLFDTGYAPRFVAATDAFPQRLYRMLTPVALAPAASAAEQLAARGIAAKNVRTVVVSHFHADHIAGLRDFPNARIVCSGAAWRSVATVGMLAGLRRGFLRALVPDDVHARLAFVDDLDACEAPSGFAAFGAPRDLLGDGSVLIVALPGHATGQIGILVPDAVDGATFLIGDAAWSEDAYEDGIDAPPRVTTAFLGETRAYRRTLDALRAVRHARPDVRIVPAHSRRVFGGA